MAGERKPVKIALSKEWCINMANREGDQEIGAGAMATDEWDAKARELAAGLCTVAFTVEETRLAAAMRAIDTAAERRGIERAAKWIPIDDKTPRDGTWLLLAKIGGHPDHPKSLWWACRGHWSMKWNNWNDGFEPCGLAGPTHYLLADGHGVRALAPPMADAGPTEPAGASDREGT